MSHGIKHTRSQSLIDYAYRFAKTRHGDQKRKYTHEPYINHPVAVARIVASVTDDCEAISAAFLHDVLEDTETEYEELCRCGFGRNIADLVMEVTDVSRPEDGNRTIRKALDLEHLAKASSLGQTIKLADLIHNTESIMAYDQGFARLYMKEKKALLEVLKGGDPTLYAQAAQIVEEYYNDR